MINKMILYVISVTLILSTSVASAKDMTHRLGLGFKNNTSVNIPSVALVYYAEKALAFTGSVGIDTQKNYANTQLSGGIRSVVYFENNLNFYVGGQVSLVNAEEPALGKANGLELSGVGGVEFYFTGLENLAFTAEAGVGLSTLRNTRIRTLADDPLRAGVIFYF